MTQYIPNNPHNKIPYGYCHCGCGQKTPIATENDASSGRVKGRPMRYLTGHHSRKHGTPEQNFLKQFTPSDKDSCWEWQGTKRGPGYGRFGFRDEVYTAHRFSYEYFIGPIPENTFVCHKCDNRSCVNPHHLFLGTARDNISDMMEKRRHNFGPKHPNSKLTESDVIEIRRLDRQGIKRSDIARRFGITYGHVYDLVKYKSWSHLR